MDAAKAESLQPTGTLVDKITIAMRRVALDADAEVEAGLSQLRSAMMTSQPVLPGKVIGIVTQVSALPKLVEALTKFPASSDAIDTILRLFSTFASTPTGCDALMSAGVPLAMSKAILQGNDVPLDIICGVCSIVSDLADEGFEYVARLIEDGSFEAVVLKLLSYFFVGERQNRLDDVYSTLVGTVLSFCDTTEGYVPYPALAPLLPYLDWALQNFEGDLLSSVSMALGALYDEGRADVDLSLTLRSDCGIWPTLFCTLSARTLRGAHPRPLLRLLCAAVPAEGTSDLLPPSIVSVLTTLLDHERIRPNTDAGDTLLDELRCATARPGKIDAIVAHPGGLNKLVRAQTKLIARTDPCALKFTHLWTTASIMSRLFLGLLVEPGGGSRNTADFLAKSGMPAWAAAVLHSYPPLTSYLDAMEALDTKARAAELMVRLLNSTSAGSAAEAFATQFGRGMPMHFRARHGPGGPVAADENLMTLVNKMRAYGSMKVEPVVIQPDDFENEGDEGDEGDTGEDDDAVGHIEEDEAEDDV